METPLKTPLEIKDDIQELECNKSVFSGTSHCENVNEFNNDSFCISEGIGVASPDFRPGHSRGTTIWPGQGFCLVRTTELLQNLVTSHFKMYTWSFCVVND